MSMTETTTQEKTIIVKKDELLDLKEFEGILKIYGTFPRAFNEMLLGEDFYIDRNFWPTLSTDDCKELFELIPSSNFHVKKIIFRILINRSEITKLNLQDYLGKLDSPDIRERYSRIFKDYIVYMRLGDSL